MQGSRDNIKRFTIMGERCSGTNYIETLFLNNFEIEIDWSFGWKHWFGFYDFKHDEYENETLFIGIIRDPIEWIDSLYRHKHHIPPENHDIEKFLFSKWYSIDDKNNEINYENIIYTDVNYINGENFKNIFELRKLKNYYLHHLMPKNVNNYMLINYNNFIMDPIKNLNLIKISYSLPLKNNTCENVTKYMKTNEPYTKHTIQLNEYYINKIKENIDLEQEKELGFNIS